MLMRLVSWFLQACEPSVRIETQNSDSPVDEEGSIGNLQTVRQGDPQNEM